MRRGLGAAFALNGSDMAFSRLRAAELLGGIGILAERDCLVAMLFYRDLAVAEDY